MPEKEENIELRSGPVQEILGHIPSWIIRWGITLMFLIILLLIGGSLIFKYPDMIYAKVTLTTVNPPVPIIAKATGKIDTIYVADKLIVKQNNILAIIDNPCSYEHLNYLKLILDSLKDNIYSEDSIFTIQLPNELMLGEIKAAYLNFYKTYLDYNSFCELNYHGKKAESLNKQIAENKFYYSRLAKQLKIVESEFNITKQQFSRDSSLFASGVSSKIEYEKAQETFLQKKYAFENSKTNMVTATMKITQLEQQQTELEMEHYKQKHEYSILLKQYFESLTGSIDVWEEQYLLKASSEGKVSFSNVWSKNQQVTIGQQVFMIIPEGKSEIIGKAELAIKGAGKVIPGQYVNVKIDNFPHMEYGFLKGKVRSISLIPSDNIYNVEIELPDSLKTNYKKVLPFSQNMQGVAEIIVKDKSVFERIVEPLISAINK